MAGPGSRTVASVFAQTEDRESVLDEYGVSTEPDATATTDTEDRFFETTVEEETPVPARRRGAVVVPEAPAGGAPVTLRPEGVAEETAGDLMNQFVGLAGEAPEFFTRIQAGLWATGLLSIGKNKFVNIAGSPNTETREAFSRLLEDVISRREAGEDITLEDVLADLDARLSPELLADLGEGPGGAGDRVTLTDPKALLLMLENAATNLGLDPDRIVTDETGKAFVAAMHSAQRGFQGGASAVSPDPTARAVAFLEDRFGTQVERAERVEETRTSQDAFNDAADVISQMVGGV